MRPQLLICCAVALAIGLSSAAHAQDPHRPRSPAQFPNPSAPATPGSATQSSMRDGVVTRAVAPSDDGQGKTQLGSHPRVPAGASANGSGSAQARLSDTLPALSDQAWTSQPSDASMQVRGQLPRSGDQGGVTQAQYTASDNSAERGRGVQLATHQSGTGSSLAASQPRPLKPPTESKPEGNHSTGTAQMFISVISSLAIVIGLMFGAAWCYRKASPSIGGALPKTVVQVLGRTPLAPRQQLVLLRIGSKLVLVSNLSGEVRTISEITDPLEVDRLAGLCESAQPGSISESFRSVLHNIGRHDA